MLVKTDEHPIECAQGRGILMRWPMRPKIGNRRNTTTSTSGQSLVEFALVLPVLLLIVLGSLDLGRVFYYEISIANAAREGVRVASNYTKTDSDIRAAARNEVSSQFSLPDSDIAISPSPTRSPGQPVTVTVSHDFSAVTPMLDRIMEGQPIRLARSAVAVVQ